MSGLSNKKLGSCCSAVGCSMRSGTNLLSKIKMFKFPRNPVRRKQWEIAVRRKNWKVNSSSVLCNLHFITGRPSSDLKHPDYVPSVFSYRTKQLCKNFLPQCKLQLKTESSLSLLANSHGKTVKKSTMEPIIPSKNFQVGFGSYYGQMNDTSKKQKLIETEGETQHEVINSKKYVQDFASQCELKCLNISENINEENRNIFNDDTQFQNWKENAVSGSEKELTKNEEIHICEVQFKGNEVYGVHVMRAANRTFNLKRKLPTLITRAVPKKLLNPWEYPEKDESERLHAVTNTINHDFKKNNTSFVVSKSTENEVNLAQEKNSTVKSLTYQKVLENFHLIKKPNSWWKISPINNFIMCARWNDNFIADKRIVIESNLTVRVFLKELEVNITDLMDITCINDISALLEKVENYNVLPAPK